MLATLSIQFRNSSNSKLFFQGGKNLNQVVFFRYLKLVLIAASQGGFIASHIWEIVGRKNLTIFKGCCYSPFCLMILSTFWKTKTKNLNSDPRILIFLVLGTALPAGYRLSKHYKWSWNRSSHSLAFIGYSKNVCNVSRKVLS